MVVLSNIIVVLSTMPCWIKFVSTFSHTTTFAYARNRLYTRQIVLVNTAKRFLVFSQYIIALSISRLLFAGRSPCGLRSGGSKSFILILCTSALCLIYAFSCLYFTILGHPAHKYPVFKQTLVKQHPYLC